MEKAEIETQLRKLTETEARILYLKCDDFDYMQIAAQFHYSEQWVQLRASEMYAKLGIPKEMHPKERKNILKVIYCPVITKMYDSSHPWPPDNPNPDPPASWLMVVQQEYQFEEEERRLALRPPVEIVDRNKDREIIDDFVEKPRPWGLYAIIIILLIALVYFIGRRSLPIQPLPTQTPLPTYTPFPTFTVPAVALFPTDSPTPISTVTSTPTSTPISIPVNILFQDNFDNGLSDQWIPESGNPLIVGGKLTSDQDTVLSVGDSNWTDYQVSFYVTKWGCTVFNELYVGIRAASKTNMVALKGGSCYMSWFTVKNGAWTEVPNTNFNPGGGDSQRISVQVIGNNFGAEGQPPFILKDYPKGKLVLKFTATTEIDDFKVTKLP